MVILSNRYFKLRKQSDSRRNGRFYEVGFTVRDSHGNKGAPQSCFIAIKSPSFQGPPVNDGRVFTVLP
jgi:hypothetical protein